MPQCARVPFLFSLSFPACRLVLVPLVEAAGEREISSIGLHLRGYVSAQYLRLAAFSAGLG